MAYRPAATSLDCFFRGKGRQHLHVSRAGQEGQEAFHRLLAGRLHDQEQQMLPVQQGLGLDGDAAASGCSGGDPGQQERALPPSGRAILGAVTVLGDEQWDQTLLGPVVRDPAGAGVSRVGVSLPGAPARVHGQMWTTDLDKMRTRRRAVSRG
jgi:hypothetical protein